MESMHSHLAPRIQQTGAWKTCTLPCRNQLRARMVNMKPSRSALNSRWDTHGRNCPDSWPSCSLSLSLSFSADCTFEKGIMLLTWGETFVCVSVCPFVTAFMARWLDIAIQYQVMVLHFARTRKCNKKQRDLFPDPDDMDHLYKITFWPITPKVMNGLAPNFNSII